MLAAKTTFDRSAALLSVLFKKTYCPKELVLNAPKCTEITQSKDKGGRRNCGAENISWERGVYCVGGGGAGQILLRLSVIQGGLCYLPKAEADNTDTRF